MVVGRSSFGASFGIRSRFFSVNIRNLSSVSFSWLAFSVTCFSMNSRRSFAALVRMSLSKSASAFWNKFVSSAAMPGSVQPAEMVNTGISSPQDRVLDSSLGVASARRSRARASRCPGGVPGGLNRSSTVTPSLSLSLRTAFITTVEDSTVE